MNKKPYCLMPFLHLHIGNGGRAKACCVANIPFGNINDQSLEEIWNGAAINQLREKFNKGETDNRCATCHKIEATGGKSIRQETFEKFDWKAGQQKALPLPTYFDIRFSNVCNFKCRTCWHGASSKWFNDAKALGNNLGEKAILTNIKDFHSFIEKTGPALLKAEQFYFAGGEPLVTKEHYLLLEWLIKNKATTARLRYNTNFSKLSFKKYEVLELWKHFSKVEIGASIDASGVLGEYIRKEMKWKEVLANRECIRKLPHVSFYIAPTVSVMNVLHLPDLYQECLDSKMIEPKGIYLNILERPLYYNIQILPPDKKEQVQNRYQQFFEWLERQQNSEEINGMFKDILNYMMAKDQSKHWPTFLKQTNQLDELRGELNDKFLF